MPNEKSDLLQGTLDMLILKIVALGPVHGYGISLRIRQISKEVLQVQQGSLHPPLHRLEKRAWLKAEWGESDNGRQAKFYSLSAKGRKQFAAEESNWNRLATARAALLETPREASLMTWWKSLFRKPDDAQLDSELRFHIEGLVEEKIAAGLGPKEARRQALLEFGGKEQWKEELRDVHRVAVIESTLSNLKYAFRCMRKSPSFAGAIILTLALGIGANSAIFSALDAILLRPLPFPNGDQLMSLIQYNPKAKNPETAIAPVRIEDWNRMNSTFQAITAYYTEDISESSGTLPEKITRAWVAPRFFEVWGIAPALGREFLPEDSRFPGPDSVIVSNRFWRRHFGADPNAIGKKIRIAPSSYSIVGIMPASFLFPQRDVDLWFPSPLNGPYTQSRESTWYTGVGRVKPGITVAQARADLATVQAQLGKQYPKTDADLAAGIQPLKESKVGGVRRSLWILFGAVSVLLLIACTNIAALLLARTAERQSEISIRYSLGASRASIVMQLLTEVFVLALAGSALALLVAGAASGVFHVLAKDL